MKKSNLEVIYFHQSIDNCYKNIKDIWYWEESLCWWKILKPDPLYIGKNWKDITKKINHESISLITLWFCRPNFRKRIFNEISDYNKIIFHFYIKKIINWIRNNIYVKSWVLNKKITWINHNIVKEKLKNNLYYLNTRYKYFDYKYKNSVSEEYDPLLVFDSVENLKMKDFININELDNKYKFKNWNNFISFNQTQSSCPFIED
jgi:hypothetical protein